MPSIQDLSIVNSNTATAKKVEHGLVRTLCSPELCDSKNLTVYKRTIAKGKSFDLDAGNDYHLVYVMNTPAKGTVEYDGELLAVISRRLLTVRDTYAVDVVREDAEPALLIAVAVCVIHLAEKERED